MIISGGGTPTESNIEETQTASSSSMQTISKNTAGYGLIKLRRENEGKRTKEDVP